MKLNARELRQLEEEPAGQSPLGGAQLLIKRRPIYLILDTVYDTYNIGGLFRLADALAMEKIYLCGDMETPPNARIKKASIGTYKVVPWEYKSNALEAIEELRQTPSSIQIIAIEQSDKSILYTEFNYHTPIAFVVGNETRGLSQEVMDACDATVEIPMFGINKSLNVIVSAAIVAYRANSRLLPK